MVITHCKYYTKPWVVQFKWEDVWVRKDKKIGFSGVYFLTYAGDAILVSQASEAR